MPRISEDAVFTPREALTMAQDLFDRGRAFHAHEVFESMWNRADDDDRELWRGLAQLAVAVTHVQRGNPTGAVELLQRAIGALNGVDAPHDIDAAGLVRYARTLMEDLRAGNELGPNRLRPVVLRRHIP